MQKLVEIANTLVWQAPALRVLRQDMMGQYSVLSTILQMQIEASHARGKLILPNLIACSNETVAVFSDYSGEGSGDYHTYSRFLCAWNLTGPFTEKMKELRTKEADLMRRFFPLAVLLASTLLQAVPALANDEDFQAWQQVIVSKALRPDVTANMEVQTRFDDDASNFHQLLLRPSIGFRILDNTVLTVGYAYVRTESVDGPDTDENRIWEQISFPILTRAGAFTLSSRTRLEQRFREDETSWRLREQLRLAIPLGQPGVELVGWSEVFYNLNATDWAGDTGFDRWRNFAGISVALSEDISIEPGYMNQLVNKATGDEVDNVFNVTLSIRY